MKNIEIERWDVLIVQTAMGDYRQWFVEELLAMLPNLSVGFLVGDAHADPSLKTRVRGIEEVTRVRNCFLFNGRMVYQRGVVRAAIHARRVVLELNPRILSVWVILLARRLLGRGSALWGHAWSRRGRGSGGTLLRDLMARTGGCVIAYSESERCDFQKRLPSVRIVTATNSLYRRRDILGKRKNASNVLYVGRLVETKKPYLLIDAFRRAEVFLDEDSRLVIVGDGPQRDELERLAYQYGIHNRTDFVGHVGEMEKLRTYYDNSLVSVSPGYVGLSAVQSFSFGVPMIVARDEPHAPEMEAIEDGENAVFFNRNDPEDLARKIEEVVRNRNYWVERREGIAQRCSEVYCVENMVRGFVTAVLT